MITKSHTPQRSNQVKAYIKDNWELLAALAWEGFPKRGRGFLLLDSLPPRWKRMPIAMRNSRAALLDRSASSRHAGQERGTGPGMRASVTSRSHPAQVKVMSRGAAVEEAFQHCPKSDAPSRDQ